MALAGHTTMTQQKGKRLTLCECGSTGWAQLRQAGCQDARGQALSAPPASTALSAKLLLSEACEVDAPRQALVAEGMLKGSEQAMRLSTSCKHKVSRCLSQACEVGRQRQALITEGTLNASTRQSTWLQHCLLAPDCYHCLLKKEKETHGLKEPAHV
eukprot:1160340-Pelagomonas_calceolata.AAC.2